MPIRRFSELMRYFHINDNNTQGQPETPNYDRYFSSIRLLRILEENGIYAFGTISKTSEGFPEELRNPVGLEWGDCLQLQHDNLVATVWNDKKMVHVVSTTSNPVGDGPVIRKIRGGGEAEIMRPPPLEDYHKYMSGVDRNMQHRSKNPVGRPAKKYWKFLVNFILEECIINAFFIWKQTEGVNKPRAGYSFWTNDFSSRKIAKSVPKSATPAVPLDRHQCVKLNRKRSTCKLCTKHDLKKRKETLFGCSACSVHLCRGLCFQLYHDQF
ncbi:hypothetical protein KUTeg_011645, partial [Tegillarca granosa]